MAEVDRIPPQRHQLGHPESVPIGDQHHGGVAVAVTVAAGGGDQLVDLGLGQVLAGTDLGIPPPERRLIAYCPIYGAWGNERQMWMCLLYSTAKPGKRLTSLFFIYEK